MGPDGGESGTGGTHRDERRWRTGWFVLAAMMLVTMAVNVLSILDDRAQVGRPLAPWKAWTWEGTSTLAWLVMLVPIAIAVGRLRPPRLSWATTLAAHAGLSIAVSLGHVGLMIAARKAIYALMGEAYGWGDSWHDLLYEYRKDALTYVVLAIMLALIDRWARLPLRGTPAMRIEVRDGGRVRWLEPGDIRWAQAAGNYVELHTTAGMLLHRATLTELERGLGTHGFVRIHRSRLVRRQLVRGIDTNPSGDFELILDDGTCVSGSRRYRAGLAQADGAHATGAGAWN